MALPPAFAEGEASDRCSASSLSADGSDSRGPWRRVDLELNLILVFDMCAFCGYRWAG
jgi:hypothetical protein